MTTPESPKPEGGGSSAENPVVEWARAVAFGVADTARDVLDEGREGARKAYDEYWRRFDAKTKLRRERKRK